MAKTAPYGSWKSPLKAADLLSDAVGFMDLKSDGETIYWTEMRPNEKGRYVLMKYRPGGAVKEMLPPDYSVRTRVHEYGGGAFASHKTLLAFLDDNTGHAYFKNNEEGIRLLNGADETAHADFTFDLSHDRIIAIEEKNEGKKEPANRIVDLDAKNAFSHTLVEGADFYSDPRVSPDGKQMSWLEWDHPDMPWDAARLMVAPLDEKGKPGKAECLAGGDGSSAFHPRWAPDGHLYYVDDPGGWWRLYWWDGKDRICLWNGEGECGLPQWVFGMSTFAVNDKGVLLTYTKDGRWFLCYKRHDSDEWKEINTEYCDFHGLCPAGKTFALLAGSYNRAEELVLFDPESESFEVIARSSAKTMPDDSYSRPETVWFDSEYDRKVHGFYYAPKNGSYQAPDGELPPLLVKTHGGPTGATSPALSFKIQYWTSRGFAVLDLNYSGSTGFGRKYRERLRYLWGVSDVEDCVAAAKNLCDRKLADPDRLAIDGGSAGGFTTLATLTFKDTFKAGASLYGISDLEALVRDTHKFESRYLEHLVAELSDNKGIYQKRSPIHHADQLSCPVIFMQGSEDKVVPPAQSEKMFNALVEKGIPTAYLLFEGEQHGFRLAENIIRALEAEFAFFGKVFGFEPADVIAPVDIRNLA